MFECLTWGSNGGGRYWNISKKGNRTLFNVAHIKFLKCSINGRTLNWTVVPP